ncbi:hypothetical protein JAAARDRAFT_243596 [Jaapia argillacea MUCL 33604]|uniref:Uncharacterized protein n=1 Tax=Jaapia argillacea MUCL 33604 TaxID=933084 RepID=A0A067QQK6_9AGAM|nr:hypothetical protein JAAARDRAFT_243596 [Jaapia argillacea MUCL 33604]
MENNEDEESDREEPEVINAADLQQELRAAAKSNKLPDHFDPHDVNYVDREDSDEDDHRVRLVERKKNLPLQRTMTDDFGSGPKKISEEDAVRLTAWAKTQKSGIHAGGSRSAMGATITGFNKAKRGDGSLRPGQRAASGPSHPRKPIKSQSMLSVVSDRRDRFDT